MRVLISGASGMVGRALTTSLVRDGHQVMALVRREPVGTEVRWDPAAGTIDARGLERMDAVVHLAGEPIAEGRWTQEKKSRIRDSRVGGTRLLAGALAGLAKKPAVLVCANAVGWYGSRGDEVLTEESAPGQGFLADVCWMWEAATSTAKDAGIRVVNTRSGIVLSAHGGALKKMLLPFRLGVGGRVGSGEQWISWVTLDDAVAVIRRAIDDPGLAGPLNVSAPGAVRNRDFTKALGKVLSRPTVMPLPAFAARVAFGEVADELLLASQRAEPRRLRERGFLFAHPDVESGLRHVLERPAS